MNSVIKSFVMSLLLMMGIGINAVEAGRGGNNSNNSNNAPRSGGNSWKWRHWGKTPERKQRFSFNNTTSKVAIAHFYVSEDDKSIGYFGFPIEANKRSFTALPEFFWFKKVGMGGFRPSGQESQVRQGDVLNHGTATIVEIVITDREPQKFTIQNKDTEILIATDPAGTISVQQVAQQAPQTSQTTQPSSSQSQQGRGRWGRGNRGGNATEGGSSSRGHRNNRNESNSSSTGTTSTAPLATSATPAPSATTTATTNVASPVTHSSDDAAHTEDSN